jgi:RecB family exonuclease
MKNLEDALKLSPSRVEAYEQCPRLYWYRYEPDSPKVTRPPSAALSFGNSLHAAMRSLYQQGGPAHVPSAHLPAMLAAVWRSEGYARPEEEQAAKRRAVAALVNYRERNRSYPTRSLYVESLLEAALDDVSLLVRPDRVDTLSPGLLAVEYKTGRNAKLGIHQMAIAYLVLWKLLRRPSDRPIRFLLVHLDSGQEQEQELAEEKAFEQLAVYSALRRRILQREFLAAPSAGVCAFCEAGRVCVYSFKPSSRED